MVRIRLRRVGAKGQPSYRIVVTDQRSPRDGRFIENVGNYNPRTEPETMVVNQERAAYWLGQGAQPSDAVARIFRALGVTASAVVADAVAASADAEAGTLAEAAEAAEAETAEGDEQETEGEQA
jgi:small subunit ribosomal protein S16